MNKQVDEARRLRAVIIEQLGQVQQLVNELGELDDASEAISREEQTVTGLLWDLYSRYKHRDHIVATFIAARRRRMLQRLQAASAALEQARAFLTADTDILPRLQQVISEAQAAALALHGPPPPYPAGAQEPEADEEEDQADDESEAEDQEEAAAPSGQTRAEAQEEAADEHRDERRALLHTAGGGDDAQETRAALAAFEERARAMRSAISSGRGWFEWHFIPRTRRYTEEARAYLERQEPVPPDVQVYEEDTRPYGPYLRYRWYEGGGRRKPIKYSLGMGLIKRRDPRRDNAPPAL
jgi:hypothetical protein